MSSYKIKTSGGKILRDGGKIITSYKGCCCWICDHLGGNQNNVVVSVSGSCGGGYCDGVSDISAYAGFEPKPVFTDHLACKWEWRYSSFSYYVLLLMYHCYYDKWYSRISSRWGIHYGGSVNFSIYDSLLDVTDYVTYNESTGLLSAAFSLPGINTCVGCTAGVSL